jgi:hypothetical protein
LKKSRDSQRITDLSTLKTAMGLYLANANPIDLGGAGCFDVSGGLPYTLAEIYYSASIIGAPNCSTGGPVTAGSDVPIGSDFNANFCKYASATTTADVNGTGWIPVDFTVLSQGSPITNLPLDPTNTVANLAAPTSSDLVYRYACQHTSGAKAEYTYEINAQLESSELGGKRTQDGGDNASYYEVGTSLKLIGIETNF